MGILSALSQRATDKEPPIDSVVMGANGCLAMRHGQGQWLSLRGYWGVGDDYSLGSWESLQPHVTRILRWGRGGRERETYPIRLDLPE